MSDMRNMMGWFGKRKEGAVQTNMRKHGLVVMDVVSEIGRAVSFMADNDPQSAIKCIDRMILSEREADRIEDRLSTSISTGELDAQTREDLLRLVRKIDKTANWAMQAGIHIQMVVETEVKVPKNIWDSLRSMSSELTLEVKFLIKALENMDTSPSDTAEALEAVKDQERIIDQIYFSTLKKVLMSDMDYRGMILARGIVEALEMSADTCKSCTDTISVLLTIRKI